jgi:hypothetical protein
VPWDTAAADMYIVPGSDVRDDDDCAPWVVGVLWYDEYCCDAVVFVCCTLDKGYPVDADEV